jgi:mRNA interferase RelE/StbE
VYELHFTADGEADLGSLSKPIAQRILKKLRWFAGNFEFLTPEALTGPWQGVFKLRIGDYRALYTFDKSESKILVHFIKHRSEVYKFK